jgi:hypothetical protein
MYKKFHCNYYTDNMEERFPSKYTGIKNIKLFIKILNIKVKKKIR